MFLSVYRVNKNTNWGLVLPLHSSLFDYLNFFPVIILESILFFSPWAIIPYRMLAQIAIHILNYKNREFRFFSTYRVYCERLVWICFLSLLCVGALLNETFVTSFFFYIFNSWRFMDRKFMFVEFSLIGTLWLSSLNKQIQFWIR